MNPIDYLYPLTDDKSRDEYILIEFKDIIRNYNEVVINKMLTNINDWKEKYPSLVKLIVLDYDTVYHLVTYRGIKDVLSNASEHKIPSDEIDKDINELSKNDIMNMSTRLHFQSALVQILSRSFVKKVYIQCEHVTDEIKDFIRKEYAIFIPDKLHLLEGEITECYFEHPELTSIFLDSADNLLKILQKDSSVNGKSFILNDCVKNNRYLDNDIDHNGIIKYVRKHADVFEESMENRGCFITYMYPLRVIYPNK